MFCLYWIKLWQLVFTGKAFENHTLAHLCSLIPLFSVCHIVEACQILRELVRPLDQRELLVHRLMPKGLHFQVFLSSTAPKFIIHISCETDSWVITTGMVALNRGTSFCCHSRICFHKTWQSGWKKRESLFLFPSPWAAVWDTCQ